jgi:hypothetical protein
MGKLVDSIVYQKLSFSVMTQKGRELKVYELEWVQDWCTQLIFFLWK